MEGLLAKVLIFPVAHAHQPPVREIALGVVGGRVQHAVGYEQPVHQLSRGIGRGQRAVAVEQPVVRAVQRAAVEGGHRVAVHPAVVAGGVPQPPLGHGQVRIAVAQVFHQLLRLAAAHGHAVDGLFAVPGHGHVLVLIGVVHLLRVLVSVARDVVDVSVPHRHVRVAAVEGAGDLRQVVVVAHVVHIGRILGQHLPVAALQIDGHDALLAAVARPVRADVDQPVAAHVQIARVVLADPAQSLRVLLVDAAVARSVQRALRVHRQMSARRQVARKVLRPLHGLRLIGLRRRLLRGLRSLRLLRLHGFYVRRGLRLVDAHAQQRARAQRQRHSQRQDRHQQFLHNKFLLLLFIPAGARPAF